MLKVKLQQYKDLTLKCIKSVNDKKYDSLLESLNKRQVLIDYINDMNYSNEEFKDICVKLDIVKLEKKLNKSIEEERLETKKQINKLINSRKAYNSYNNGLNNNFSFLKKRI